MQRNIKLSIHSLQELESIAQQIITFAQEYRFWVFDGAMGVGKTTLIKAICQQLGSLDHVSSPTFALVNEYQTPKETIYHFDFYRLKNENEAFDLGYEDYFYANNYCFIEWASKIPNLLPPKRIEIKITLSENQSRQLDLIVMG